MFKQYNHVNGYFVHCSFPIYYFGDFRKKNLLTDYFFFLHLFMFVLYESQVSVLQVNGVRLRTRSLEKKDDLTHFNLF